MGRRPEINVSSYQTKKGRRTRFRYAGHSWLLDGYDLTKREIEEERQRELARILLGTWQEPTRRRAPSPTSVPTVVEACDDYLAYYKGSKGRSEKAVSELTRHLTHLKESDLGSLPINEVSRRAIENYQLEKHDQREVLQELLRRQKAGEELTLADLKRARLKKPPSSNDRGIENGQINVTVAVLARVIEREMKSDAFLSASMGNVNPAKDPDLRLDATPPRRLALRPSQLRALLAAGSSLEQKRAGDPQRGHLPYRLLILTLVCTGLRVSELTGLRRRDVGLESGVLTVERGKTRAARRTVPLSEVLAGELKAWLGRTHDGDISGPLFPNKKGGHLDPVRFADRVLRPTLLEADEAQRMAGGDTMPTDLQPHDCRRTFATMAYQRRPSMSVAWVMGVMGHRSPQLALDVYYDHAQGSQLNEREQSFVQELTEGW